MYRAELGVTMRGPTDLWVTVQRCRDCTIRREYSGSWITVADGTFARWIPVVEGPAGQRMALEGSSLRPASLKVGVPADGRLV